MHYALFKPRSLNNVSSAQQSFPFVNTFLLLSVSHLVFPRSSSVFLLDDFFVNFFPFSVNLYLTVVLLFISRLGHHPVLFVGLSVL